MKGFTLLEVLLAAIVLTVGTVAIMMAFNSGIFATTDIENVEDALNAGQLRMEEIFAELQDMDLTLLTAANASDYETRKSSAVSGYDVAVDLHEDDLTLADDQNLIQVDVTVTWDTKGGEAEIILTTLVTDY